MLRFIFRHTLYVCLFFSQAAWPQNVLTQRYNDARTGANLNETQLTTANVNVNQFGKLFTLTVDGNTQASPLYVQNVTIPGKGVHNVLYIATMNDKVYAFDADSNTGSNASPLWMDDFTNPAAGITPVPITDVACACNITGNVGIESTPAIDLANNTLYLVARTKENGSYFQRLHALDITTGAERPGSPVHIQATVSGTGIGSSGGKLSFDPLIHNQRPSLAIANGKIFIAWASHEDTHNWHGWIIAYDTQTLAQAGVFCTSPNDGQSGIWESGWAPAVDASGNIYYMTGNGTGTAGANNLAESFIKFNTTSGLQMVDWFTPSNWAALNSNDVDLAAAGSILIPGTNLIVGGGKEAIFYLLDTGNLGHEVVGNTQIVQQFAVNNQGTTRNGEMKGGPVYWDRSSNGGPWMYVWAENDFLKAYHFNGVKFDTTPISQSTFMDAAGASPGVLTLSSNGDTQGIIWSSMCTSSNCDHGVHPGILRAFDATNLTQQLWNSGMNSTRDNAGNWPKFSIPLVVNGKVYLGSFSNQVNVYGLLSVTPDFTLSASPATNTVIQGNNATYTATVGSQNGFSGSVSLSVSGLPSGAGFNFNPAAISGSGSSTLTVTTSTSTPTGTYMLTIHGDSGSLSHTFTVTLTVNPPPVPDFSFSAAPASQTITVGSGTSYTATASALNGFSGSINVSVSGLPSGATANSCTITVPPTGSCALTVTTSASTPAGTYTLTITGTSGSLSHNVTVKLVVNPTTGLPPGWTDADIGAPGLAGSATFNGVTFTVKGGGADIWSTADHFNFASQSVTGDLTITARVASQQNTSVWAKAGVMIRQTTAANSAYVFVMITPSNGVNMQYRPTTGGTSVQLAQQLGHAAPYWVRLVRSGNTFTGFSSADGVTWTTVGTISMTMTGSTNTGLAVTAHNNTALCTATFDNVSIGAATTTPDFTLSASPSSQTVTVGGATSYTATVSAVNSFSGSVSLGVTGLPANATGSFNPTSVSTSGSSTLSISTSASTPTGTYTLTITGTSGTLSHSAAVTLVVNPVTASCVTATGGGGWVNTPFAAQAGTFTASFDATPSANLINGVVALSHGAGTAYTAFANLVAFSGASNVILARNGGSYAAQTNVPYSAGLTYHFRLVVNVPAHTYSIFVTPPGGTEQTIGSNYLFRTEQNTVTSLNNDGVFVGTTGNTLKVCNFSIQ